MWNQTGSGNGNGINGDRKCEGVTVAIDKDKGSQYALKWAVDHLLSRGQTVTLIHVKQRPSSIPTPMGSHVALSDVHDGVAKAIKNQVDNQAKEMFLPFRAFCTRKDIKTNEIITEDTDIARALCDYVKINSVDTLVLGSPSRNSFVRFKSSDVPTSVSRGAPEFCTVYVISKGKVSSVRSASMAVPTQQSRSQNQPNPVPRPTDARSMPTTTSRAAERMPSVSSTSIDDQQIKSPFNRSRDSNRSYGDLSMVNSDISFVSSNRPSTDRSGGFMSPFVRQETGPTSRLSFGIDNKSNFVSPLPTPKSPETSYTKGFSSSDEDTSMPWLSSNTEDMEAEMRRLKQELKQTMDMYSSACKEALSAKQKTVELNRWKKEEEHKLGEALQAEEAAMEIVEREKAKTKAAIEAAEAAQRIAEREAQKRINAEMKALKESEEKDKVLNALAQCDTRYRKYTIEEIEAATDNFADSRKIGEGGYGPVYKCILDHTAVAIKVLRPDAAQGRSQFQQEIEVLSCIRHPNMVLLLGACPEYGCLVYEFMANGSLEDCLFRKGKTGVLPWQLRFQIAAEIGTGLLFLHQTKPEPLVHRDLKPGNILLDRNFVSKISDVGLARLVPPSVANTVTQYRMTSTAGTFCYIDPEYQQTGMLGIKSDIYSLGIMLLQMVTAKPPMGLTHHVEKAIERGTFHEMLDPAIIPGCPVEEAIKFCKLALECAELRRKDRPDLGTVILPELNRLRALAEETMPINVMMLGCGTPGSSPNMSIGSSSLSSQFALEHEIIRDPMLRQLRAGSSPSKSSVSNSSQ